MRRNPTWPDPRRLLDEWASFAVPDVQVVDFQIGSHYGSLPWVSRKTGKQLISNVSPDRWTAAALCQELPNYPPEVRAAFKIDAVCRHASLAHFPRALVPIYDAAGLHQPRWWHPTAKHVLPPTERQNFAAVELFAHRSTDGLAEAKAWRSIVHISAQLWRAIAEEWAIIRIPDWMDPKSDEYAAWQLHLEQEANRRDRLEYERLKEKFHDT